MNSGFQQRQVPIHAPALRRLGEMATWIAAAIVLLWTGISAAEPAEAPAASTPAPPQPTASAGETAGPSYDMRLRDLEERVVDLKEKVYRSKSRLMLLREQVLHNVIAEANAIIIHDNQMGVAFDLEQVIYYLDGERIYFRDNRDGQLADVDEIEIFNGSVTPGNHIVAVELLYRGDGGIFTYVDGYSFRVKSNYTFFANKGRITRLAVVGYERGGITTDLQDKPYVRYEVQQFQYSRENLDALASGVVPEPVSAEESDLEGEGGTDANSEGSK